MDLCTLNTIRFFSIQIDELIVSKNKTIEVQTKLIETQRELIKSKEKEYKLSKSLDNAKRNLTPARKRKYEEEEARTNNQN